MIGHVSLEFPHVERFVEMIAVAGLHARRRTHATADGGERRSLVEDGQRTVELLLADRRHEASNVVSGRAAVVARRRPLAPQRALRGPLAGAHRRRRAHRGIEDAGRLRRRRGRPHALGSGGQVAPKRGGLESPTRGIQVVLRELELLDRGLGPLEGKLEDARHRAQQRGVHDRGGPGAEMVLHRDAGGVHGGDAVAGEVGGKVLRRLRAVEQYPASRLEPGEDAVPGEAAIEHDHVIGLVDLIPVGDLVIVHPHERVEGRAGALGGVHAESLDVLAAQEVGRSDQLGQGDPSLSASTEDDDLDHSLTSLQCVPRRLPGPAVVVGGYVNAAAAARACATRYSHHASSPSPVTADVLKMCRSGLSARACAIALSESKST